MKKIFLFAILVFAGMSVFAQTIKGKVFDAATNAPLQGATVAFAGDKGTTTDKDGNFSIACGTAKRIIISYVGYEGQEIIIKNCSDELSIGLAPVGHTLDAVEITATSNPNKILLYQPVSINKLGKTELKRGLGLFLDDAINTNVPGVSMQRRAVSSGQQFNIRGYGNGSGGTSRPGSNFDGQGYKVYLNGIPITDAEGITVMDDIDFGSVGDVEITKGPSGTLYGLAIAGVVNLKTYKPEAGKTSIGQEAMFGSYGLQRFTTHFGMNTGKSSMLLNYGHQQTDGYTIHNASKKDFVNLAGDFSLNEKQSVNYYFSYSKSYDERSGELTLAQYAAKDYSGNIEYIKRNGHSAQTSFRAGIGHTYSFSKNVSNTTTVFGTAYTNNNSSAAGWTDKDPFNFGLRSAFNTNFALQKGISLNGITGVETQRQLGQTISYNMVDPQGASHVWQLGDPYFVIDSVKSNQYTTTGNTSLFTQWTLQLPKDLSVTAGIGYSSMHIDLNDRFFRTPISKRHYETNFKNMVSPSVAINKVFNKKVSVYASYSKGYKAPTSSYFYIPYTGALNLGLKPEIGNQFEIGTKGSLMDNKLDYQLALFNTVFSNKMSNINVMNSGGTATLYTYVVNGGKQNDKGIEAQVRFTAYQSNDGFFKTVKPFANFTYSDFKYDNFSFHYKGKILIDSVVSYDGKAVAGVPKLTANIGLDVNTTPGIYANIVWSHKDKFPITSDGLNMTSAYSLVNAKLGYQHSLSAHFDLDASFGINNIGGTQYPIMVFVNQLPDAYMAAPLKTYFFGGVNLKYNF